MGFKENSIFRQREYFIIMKGLRNIILKVTYYATQLVAMKVKTELYRILHS